MIPLSGSGRNQPESDISKVLKKTGFQPDIEAMNQDWKRFEVELNKKGKGKTARLLLTLPSFIQTGWQKPLFKLVFSIQTQIRADVKEHGRKLLVFFS